MGTNLNQEAKGYVKGYKIYNDKNLSKINPDPEAFRIHTADRRLKLSKTTQTQINN